MKRPVSLFALCAGAAGAVGHLVGRVLLMAAALTTSAPFGAPLAARAIAGRSETFATLFICFASGGSLPDAQKGRPGPANDRGIDCVLCQTLCRGAAPPAAWPGRVGAAPIQPVNLPWMVADHAAPAPRPRLSNRARAPPAGSGLMAAYAAPASTPSPPCGVDAERQAREAASPPARSSIKSSTSSSPTDSLSMPSVMPSVARASGVSR